MADLPDNPNNREEEYLADIAGLPNNVPENPWSRKEAYLAAISGRLDGIDEKIAALATDISLKGGVDSYDDLPEDAEIGDAYITEDTGILYVWVGDEWTPLNMQGGSGITELTTSDYNYPADNPNTVGLWLLTPGQYKGSGISISPSRSGSLQNSSDLFVIGSADQSGVVPICMIGQGGIFYYRTSSSTGLESGTIDGMNSVLKNADIYSNGARNRVKIGTSSASSGNYSIAIGGSASATTTEAIAIGALAAPTGGSSPVAIGASSGGAGAGGVSLGALAKADGNQSVSIGYSSSASKASSVAIGGGNNAGNAAAASGDYAVAIGPKAKASVSRSVALGYSSATTRYGEVNIGATNNAGYNDTAYRVLGGVHDPVDAHDAATKGYVDGKNLVFYMSVDPAVTASQVSVYSDASCTTPISLRTFFSALRDGKSVCLQYRNGSGEEDHLYSFQIVTSSLTNVDTEDAYNEVSPYAIYYVGSGWKRIGAYAVDPDATTGAFNISSQA